MNFKERARPLKAMGFPVFPIVRGGKKPLFEGWQEDARSSAECAHDSLDCNVGVYTWNLLVVDIDVKGKKNGEESIMDLALEGLVLPETYTVTTPSGGRHLYYRVSSPVRSRVELFPGVDIRGSGGYVVGAGSETPQGTYQANELELVDAPGWLVERVGAKRGRPARGQDQGGRVDQEAAKNRARHYLEHEAPLAVEGQGGDHTTFKVCAQLKDLGLTINRAAELLFEVWNPRCQPPWAEGQLLQKLENAYRYGENAIGAKAPEAEFERIENDLPETPEPRGPDYLEEINKDHALIFIDGSQFILHETNDNEGNPKLDFFSEAAFRRKFSPYKVLSDGGKLVSKAVVWLDWKGRREYTGKCFSPGRAPRRGLYNLWRGFTCGPKDPDQAGKDAREGLELFMEHTLENVCGGDETLHRWLLGYFAHSVQKPFERPLTTLVFRGPKGVGKNTPVEIVGTLFGPHFLVAHNSRYLTSNFNGHMERCLYLVLDEAFWSGDKSAEGILKGLSTARTILVEHKNMEPIQVKNLVRLVVIGNEDWLVPASADERRYAVFDVGTKRQQQNEYFERMRVLMDHKGGASLLLHTLLTFDLGSVDVNRAPKTQGLHDQKLASLDLLHEFWLECLRHGEIVGLDFGTGWPESVSKSAFRNAFISYKEGRNARGWNHSDIAIGKLLRQCMPALPARAKARDGDKTVHVYRLPSLAEARADWDKFIGHTSIWD